jgi:SAM-dependent methyltransferase
MIWSFLPRATARYERGGVQVPGEEAGTRSPAWSEGRTARLELVSKAVGWVLVKPGAGQARRPDPALPTRAARAAPKWVAITYVARAAWPASWPAYEGSAMNADSYLLDNRALDARSRFEALSALFDWVTVRHVDGIGVSAGWRCWEVGAGGPGVPRLLAERVCAAGHVLATDLDVGWMGTDLPGNVEVRRHDVATDEPPDRGFDLVHTRLVLVHVPQRDEALRRMVAALRPGGWLLIEDFDVNLQHLRASMPGRRPITEPTGCAPGSASCWQRGASISPTGGPCRGCCVPRASPTSPPTRSRRWRCPPPQLSRSPTSGRSKQRWSAKLA